MARYEPVQFDKLTPEHKALYENVRGKRPKLVGPFSVLMHNPRSRARSTRWSTWSARTASSKSGSTS